MISLQKITLCNSRRCFFVCFCILLLLFFSLTKAVSTIVFGILLWNTNIFILHVRFPSTRERFFLGKELIRVGSEDPSHRLLVKFV